ncbi:MAG TPA: hypothetical protein VF718_03330 [Allosphingosinicella sp.]|jgi:hypothetical protein
MLRELFNRTRTVKVESSMASFAPPGTGGGAGTTTTKVEREGAFVTPQSLVSFAGATAAVTAVWKGLGIVRPDWGQSPVVALTISALVGLAIYLIGETDPAAPAATTRQRLISGLIAIINTFVIFSAAVGANQIAKPAAQAAERQAEAPAPKAVAVLDRRMARGDGIGPAG